MSKKFRGRQSCPPLRKQTYAQIKAREMPDFSKNVLKPIESNRDLTVPEGFELASVKRHREALALKTEKLK